MDLNLTEIDKEQLAIALILLKDWKAESFDFETSLYVIQLAQKLGIFENFQNMLGKVPPFRIVPR